MSKLLRNTIAVLVGIAIGGSINVAFIILGPSRISPPAGVDVSSAAMQTPHLVMPFLAHAIGTLAGALTAYLIAASYKVQIAYAIGAIFLCVGLATSFMIPAPTWFVALDLLVAYIPMAWLAIRIGTRMKQVDDGARKIEV
jgi:hypothetical protein